MTRFWITIEDGVNFVMSCLGIMSGGEIFVPKIPSMKITKIASLIAPDHKQVEVGIRPGEKLHEVMITRDDAINTIEMHDRYVILPSIRFNAKKHVQKYSGNSVPEDFHYASDTNVNWMIEGEFMALLEKYVSRSQT